MEGKINYSSLVQFKGSDSNRAKINKMVNFLFQEQSSRCFDELDSEIEIIAKGDDEMAIYEIKTIFYDDLGGFKGRKERIFTHDELINKYSSISSLIIERKKFRDLALD